MPFLRFSRDKRGYEHTYLVQATNRRGKSVRPRVLYWYRTPPGVLVGRQPFDDDVRKALEVQHPGVVFDWVAIAETRFPPQEAAEPWRERRRAERAARQVRREEEEGEPAQDEVPTVGIDNLPPDTVPAAALTAGSSGSSGPQEELGGPTADATPSAPRKRRRRGGRGLRGPSGESADGGPTEPSTETIAPAELPDESAEDQD